jgi:hypothetical protein
MNKMNETTAACGEMRPETVVSAEGVGWQDLTLLLRGREDSQASMATALGLESTLRKRGRPKKLLEK